jgi:hypothetical protein
MVEMVETQRFDKEEGVVGAQSCMPKGHTPIVEYEMERTGS